MTATKAEVSELVEELEKYKGKHTEFITVYIPAGYDVVSVQKQLEAEKATAKNIKSTTTRNNVIDALEKIVRELKGLKKSPTNGLALFCGDISPLEGVQDIKFWVIEPPHALNTRLYRCDKEFVLDPLKQMLEVEELFGLLVMDRKEATIGLLEGKLIQVLQKMTSGIPSQIRAGGQCLSPDIIVQTKKGIKRIADINAGDELKALNISPNKVIFTKCLNKWKKQKTSYKEIILKDCWNIIASDEHIFFIERDDKIIKKLAKNISKNDLLITYYDNKPEVIEVKEVINVNEKMQMIDIETESKNFFANGILVHNSAQRFHRITEGLTKEYYKRVADEMKKIFYTMPKLKGIIVGGPVPTKDEFIDGEYLIKALKEKVIGRIDIGDTSESGLNELVEKSGEILAKQEITKEKDAVKNYFNALKESHGMATLGFPDTKKALEYGASQKVYFSTKTDRNVQKELTELATNSGAEIIIISTETVEGQQFYNLGGVGSILRFKI